MDEGGEQNGVEGPRRNSGDVAGGSTGSFDCAPPAFHLRSSALELPAFIEGFGFAGRAWSGPFQGAGCPVRAASSFLVGTRHNDTVPRS